MKVGNAEVEKANYDYFSFMYEKMPKEYVVADLVSKCEDYDKLYKNYEMKDLQIEEIRKELINQDKYIAKLKKEYANQLQQKRKSINDYEILILKVERYLNCYQYFLETQEENNKKIANMIHEFSLKDSDKE